ncbi:cobalt transporter CbiM [Campylobacterota bacterium]|nr:cobalt transporter CbiM [Campylobacterota bacterium]
MHIAEGFLRPEILIAGGVVGGAFAAYAFKTVENEELPKVAACSALFFLASFVHISIGISSVHLILSGIVGALLGVRAFVAIGTALLLQGLLFGFGGITTLGINLCILALPALLARALFVVRLKSAVLTRINWFLIGFLPIALGTILLALALAINGEGFWLAAEAAFVAHIPIMFLEGVITLLAFGFLQRVRPELLKVER